MLDADLHLPPSLLGLDARLHEHSGAPGIFHVLLVAEYVERSGRDAREALCGGERRRGKRRRGSCVGVM